MTIFTAVPVIVALLLGYLIGVSVQKVASRFEAMQKKINELTEKLDRIETKSTHRNPYRTNDGLEDAMAIIHDTVWQADATLDYVRSRMKQVNETLKTIRSNPDKYNNERPNQKK